MKLVALSTKLPAWKRIWLLENEVEFLKMKLSERKWNRMPENEITCIFFEIDKGMSTSNQFRCEIERPFTNLNDISTKLAGKTYSRPTCTQKIIYKLGQQRTQHHEFTFSAYSIQHLFNLCRPKFKFLWKIPIAKSWPNSIRFCSQRIKAIR